MDRPYVRVDEPGVLDMAEDDVYPNQAVRTMSSSLRSLEPIVSGDISLKHVFYDPRWSPNQKRCCLIALAILVIGCLSILIALFVGLGKVLAFIKYQESVKQSGLFVFPYAEEFNNEMLRYCRQLPNENCKRSVDLQVASLKAGMKNHITDNTTGNVPCTPGTKPSDANTICRFESATLRQGGVNCSEDNNYGYTSGQPCIFFTLDNMPSQWDSGLKGAKSYLSGLALPNKADLNENYIPLYCMQVTDQDALTSRIGYKMSPAGGFDLNFIPKKKSDYYVPPGVMLQFTDLPLNPKQLVIKCGILAPNLKQLRALTEVEFTISDETDND